MRIVPLLPRLKINREMRSKTLACCIARRCKFKTLPNNLCCLGFVGVAALGLAGGQSSPRFSGEAEHEDRRVIMDKETEQRIRERAYELWIQHGSLPGRADEYWYQAEQEILGRASQSAADETGSHAIIGSDEEAPVETSPAPLGMTSQTLDEVLTPPVAPKTRRRKSTASEAAATVSEMSSEVSGETVVAPKRRRSTKSTT